MYISSKDSVVDNNNKPITAKIAPIAAINHPLAESFAGSAAVPSEFRGSIFGGSSWDRPKDRQKCHGGVDR